MVSELKVAYSDIWIEKITDQASALKYRFGGPWEKSLLLDLVEKQQATRQKKYGANKKQAEEFDKGLLNGE